MIPEQPRQKSDALISVVVPCYNVAPYLEECLESVTLQTHSNLQIIAVDDGSTDDTAVLLRHWAARDDRILVITQSNGGLGAARNTGVAAAVGDFITFVDSDDVLPARALEVMVASADVTGSDLVTGVVRRFDAERSWKVSLHLNMFTRYRPATHIFERPSLVRDHIVCGKLYRRDFWEREGLRFPEGVLFEDIELATRAHCLARSVDIVPEAIYRWRRRPGGDLSITQDRTRPGGVTGRFDALTATDHYLREHAPEAVWIRHGRKVFEADLPIYTAEFENGGDRYRNEMIAAAAPLMASLSPVAVQAQGDLRRYLHRYLAAGDARSARGVIRLMTYPRTVGAIARGFWMVPMRDRPGLALVGVRQVMRGLARRLPFPLTRSAGPAGGLGPA